ncbi:hypothetical protein A5482_007345 [Cyanobacterium sp. IPPAS B-1200]|uniref:hypothetical protein n=1 Tax=Cyanobacterium sp. IPPAS B-1200 TaxID=1562720 RepID=UPI0008527CBD|nr:hypothetical protein [Cyanobacterium sp. IPPAS B-1200]OEJ78129.1 hypothetical protein A5482_14080 [Cyanobacterium sp. IPPAS B-1200]
MERVQRKIRCDRLPLAIYREVAAHLRQIQGIEVSLLEQTSQEFEYLQSQVGGLLIEYDGDLPTKENEQLESILAYYASKYNSWSNLT